MANTVRRLAAAVAGCGGFVAVLLTILVLLDVRAFEYAALLRVVGAWGLTFFAFLFLGVIALSALLLRAAFSQRTLIGQLSTPLAIALALWVCAFLWLTQWVFMEQPLTVRLANAFLDAKDRTATVVQARERARADLDALKLDAAADRAALAVMIERSKLNRPEIFAAHPLGATIDKYATRYQVEPALLLGWLYLDSFYGEAPAGRMPVLRAGTAETFRDLIQLHVPTWFVESPLRTGLIESDGLERVFGSGFGNKLRYALQKATYDVSLEPFEADAFCDVFLMLQEYPEEFPELFGPDARPDPLVEAFRALQSHALPRPYEDPYVQAARDPAYYDAHREQFVSFARAAAYRLWLDFDFATRVQALVARFNSQWFERTLGPELWSQVPRLQKVALVTMLADVYAPNIGRLSYNLYNLPEFNLAPFAFVASQAAADPAGITASAIWRPKDAWKLWGGTALKLSTILEVWDAMSGAAPVRDPKATATLDDAIAVLARAY